MTLLDVITKLSRQDDELTIYAKSPWSINSDAILDYEPEEGGLPDSAIDLNMEYFIGVYTALDFIDGWRSNKGALPSEDKFCERLIKYVINDA